MITAVRNVLIAAPGVSALVGSRIYPGVAPQALTYPAVVLTSINEADPVTHDGKSGLVDGQLQVDSYATDYLGAKALCDAIKAVLNGYTVGNVQGIFLVRARDWPYDSAANVYRRLAEYNVWSK